MVDAISLGFVSQARAAAPYNNSDLATKALTYVGQAGTAACRDAGKTGGDQCKQFVNCIVWMVSDGRQWPAPGYHSGFQAVGGVEVTRSAATTGDVIQVGNADSDNPLHTAIVVRNRGNNNFEVVDANWGFTGMVAKHMWSPPSGARIWRLGTSASGVSTRLVGDFNGDGLWDAAVMFRDQGIAKVALSTGGSFGYPGDWSYGHSVGAHSYFSGDVNGDGRDDLVAYFASSRTWKVSLSSGSGFWTPVEWAYDGSLAPDRVFFADTTGDGRDDKIMFAGSSWYVSVSSGTGFWAPQVWRPGHGVGSNDQIVGDFNGDNLADAAVYFAANGKWYVALSAGSSFGYPGEWSYEHGLGTTLRVAGDTTGDGKGDIVYYSQNIFKWWVGASLGSGFWSLNEWSYDGTAYAGASNVFLADVNGDRRDDKILFYASTGNWYVGISSGSGFWSLQPWIVGHGTGS